MAPALIAMAAATVALAGGQSRDHVLAIPELPRPSTPTSTPVGLAPRRTIRLTIGVSGDLLPHLPIVDRAHVLAGGRGYDFRPMLRPIRPGRVTTRSRSATSKPR